MMNKSESAIKSLYFRTLASLRTELEERGWTANEILGADAGPGDYTSGTGSVDSIDFGYQGEG